MTEGNMTGQPYGGVQNPPEEQDVLPGERPASDEERPVEAAPEQSPRAAQGGTMSTDQHGPEIEKPGSGTEPMTGSGT